MPQITYNAVSVTTTDRRTSTRDDKKYMRTVTRDGKEYVVHYGSPDMRMRTTNDDARENFQSRHNCSEKTDPLTPGFWACYDWRDGQKAADTPRRMFLVSSNPYRDRDGDIVAEKVLHDYVRNFTENDLLFWHTGHPIGRIVKAEMVGRFLIEEAVEAPNRVIVTRSRDGRGTRVTTVKRVWDEIENEPEVFNAASIGFRYQRGDKDSDRVFNRIHSKHETSVLPHAAAANKYTSVEVIHDEFSR